jgi:hypothetical protein
MADVAVRLALERAVLAGKQSTRQFAIAGQLATSR